MKLEILKGSENYTCQVIKLPNKIEIQGLNNLVSVNYQGNSCLISKESNENELYLFFPVECELNHEFLSNNNLYRHTHLNVDASKKGFFEDNRRVKAIKFKSVISSGFIIPIDSLDYLHIQGKIIVPDLKIENEFNSINGIEICKKYIKYTKQKGMSNPKTKVLDEIIDSKFVPEHPDTSHLLKNIHKLDLNDYIAVTYKLHGTSARYYNTLVKRKLTIKDKIAKFFGVKIQEESYDFVAGSRRCIKSVGFEELPNKNHFFSSGDLWSEVGKEYFEGKLNAGEAIYCEIVGKTYSDEDIQPGYSYGFNKPKVYIYRISNINSQGIEVDLSYLQMKERCNQLGVDYCPELFYGTIQDFFQVHYFDKMFPDFPLVFDWIFYNRLLEQQSILDNSVVEEGFCIRKDTCNRPEIYKIKSKQFLLYEGQSLDKEIKNIEEEQNV
jgi:hypothetical protein